MAEAPRQPVRSSGVLTTVLKINKKEFVSGLLWMVIENTLNPMKGARELAKSETPNLDVVVIRRFPVTQGGFVAKGSGAHKGMYSLASVLASGFGPSFLGIFELSEDRYALVGVSEGSIVPQYDYTGSRAEVTERLRKKYGITDWKRVIAPAEFGIGGDEIDIETAVRSCVLKSEHKLKPLTFGLSQKSLIQYGIVAVIGGSFFAGYLAWNSYQEKQYQAEMQRKAQERIALAKRLSEELKRQVGMTSLTKPWTTTPSLDTYLGRCEKAIGAAPLALGGWEFVQAKCEPSMVMLSYKRGLGGTTQMVVEDLTSRFGSQVRPSFDAFDGIVNVRFKQTLPGAGDDKLMALDARRISFISHFQAIGVVANIKEQASELNGIPILPDGRPWPRDIALPKPDWHTFGFSLDTTSLPTSVFSNLSPNGIRPDLVEAKLSGNLLSWTIKGKFYAK